MKVKQFVSSEKRAVLCTTVALTLMAAGLTVLQTVSGYRPLLLLGLMLWLPAAVQLVLLLPLWDSKPLSEEKQKLPARLWSKAKFYAPQLRKLIICAVIAAALVVTHLLFWKDGSSKATGYYLPVVLVVLFVGAMGSDLAIESADIALMNNNLMNIPFAVALARRTRKIIYQNLVLSVGISVTMIALSAFGVISALAGSVLHNLGAFAVLLNSSRILREE